MDTRIYVHGRPQGQDIWSPKEDSTDRFYLEPFLDSRVGSDVDSAMIIDIWQKHCYYTYIRCKNVVEKSVRPNAYFAITVRFDGVCKNVASLYNLLDLIYNKVCLGNLIANENGQEHILVYHWNEKENVLQQINTLILQNVDKVILPYISAIENPKDTKNAGIQKWSLKDVDCPLFVSACQNHRVVVSPYYKSKDSVHEDDLKRVAPLEAECAKLKDQVSIWVAKNESTENARALLEKKSRDLTIEIDTLKKEVKSIREDVTNQYKDEISKYRTEKQKAENNLYAVEKTLKDKTAENEELKKKYDQLEKKYKEKGSSSGHSPVNDKDLEIVRLMAERFPVLLQEDSPNTSKVIKSLPTWLSIINTILLVALVCLCCFLTMRTNNAVSDCQKTLKEISDKQQYETNTGDTIVSERKVTDTSVKADNDKAGATDENVDINADTGKGSKTVSEEIKTGTNRIKANNSNKTSTDKKNTNNSNGTGGGQANNSNETGTSETNGSGTVE